MSMLKTDLERRQALLDLANADLLCMGVDVLKGYVQELQQQGCSREQIVTAVNARKAELETWRVSSYHGLKAIIFRQRCVS